MLQRYFCPECWTIYDPKAGQPDREIAPDTLFEDLPTEWTCTCGAESTMMKKYDRHLCPPCGYIYDPVTGDIDSGIEPGTLFDDIPDDWMCPVCGVSKELFEPYYD